MTVKGIIFDMDGVISDTQKLHARVESELLSGFGIEITPAEVTRRYAGVRTEEFFGELLRAGGKEYDLGALMKLKWSRMEAYASVSVDAVDGAAELVNLLSGRGFPLAVASASNFAYVRQVLERLGIIGRFSYIVSGDMVARGKPDPESFLLAAAKIGIVPEDCLVIEDGLSGMEAAKRAGMFCVGLVGDRAGAYPTANLVTNLSEVTFDYLARLVK